MWGANDGGGDDGGSCGGECLYSCHARGGEGGGQRKPLPAGVHTGRYCVSTLRLQQPVGWFCFNVQCKGVVTRAD